LPDDGDPDVPLDERLITLAQLRDVPAAERSAIVPKENEGERLVHPEARQANLRAVEGEDLGVGRALPNHGGNLGMHDQERIGLNVVERIGVPADTL
jgi:hypothetical protein